MCSEQIVAVFDSTAVGEAAILALHARAIPASAIRCYQSSDTSAPQIAASRAAHIKSIMETFWTWLVGDGHPRNQDDHIEYESDITDGRCIVAVHAVDQDQSATITRVLQGHQPTELKAQPETSETVDNSTTQSGVRIRRYPIGVAQPVYDPGFPITKK